MTRSITGAVRSRGCLKAFLLCLALVPALAAAQYQWRDANGRMVYSNLPPPPEVARSEILRSPAAPPSPAADSAQAAGQPDQAAASRPAQPGETSEAAQAARSPAAESGVTAAATGAAGSQPTEDAAAKPGTWAEKAEAFRKRRADRARAEAAQEEAQQQAARKQRECADMQASLRLLESRQRIARMDAQGQRVALSASERASRADEVRNALASRCDDRG